MDEDEKVITMEETGESENDESENQVVGPQQLELILSEAKKQEVQELSLSGLLLKATQHENPSNSDEQVVEVSCPSEICDNASLTKLNLSANSLASLPPLFGLLGSLTDLDLSRNRLSSLPSSFSRLENLRTLDLSANLFSSVPEECYSHLTNLVNLSLDDNSIKTLPNEVGKMVNLKTLRLEGNGLKELAVGVGELRDLEVLDLSANELVELPSSLLALTNLKELYLLGNPLRIPAPESAAFSTHKGAITAYLLFTAGAEFADTESTREILCQQFPGVEVAVIHSLLDNCGSAAQALDFLLSMNAPPGPSNEGGRSQKKPLKQSSLRQLTPVVGLRKMLANLTQPTTPAKGGDEPQNVAALPQQNKFLQYENENNRMFRALSTQAEYHDILTILLEKGMTLLVPQDIVLEGLEVDRSLLMGHTISWDTEEEDPDTHSRPFTTTNGSRGHLNTTTQTFHLLPNQDETEAWEAAVLRTGEFTIVGITSPIPVYLISSPLGPTTPASSQPSDSSSNNSADSTPSSSNKEELSSSSSTSSSLSASKTPQHPVPESTVEKDGFDIQLAKPLVLDAFINKLHNKASRNLRLAIEQFVRSMQKKGPVLEDQRDYIFRFLESARQQMYSLPPWKNISKSESSYSEDALDTVVFTKIYKSIFYTASDQERDMMLSAKMKKLQFVTPDMLGIPPKFCNRKMWAIAERELLMMNSYCSPKDKLKAVINCCKVIIQLLNTAENTAGADDFLPHLCIVVLRAYPPHMHSNVRFISRYIGQNVLVSETLYYYTQVVSVISFIENIEAQHLNLTQLQFERYMEGHGETQESAPPVPNHENLPNQGASYKSSILSLTAPSPQPKSTYSFELKKYDKFLGCGSVDELRVGDLAKLLHAFQDLSKAYSSLATAPQEAPKNEESGEKEKEENNEEKLPIIKTEEMETEETNQNQTQETATPTKEGEETSTAL